MSQNHLGTKVPPDTRGIGTPELWIRDMEHDGEPTGRLTGKRWDVQDVVRLRLIRWLVIKGKVFNEGLGPVVPPDQDQEVEPDEQPTSIPPIPILESMAVWFGNEDEGEQEGEGER